ncbi:hypothetical protein BBJ28_00022879, partial [Nothophytophthora sp. Chile5]
MGPDKESDEDYDAAQDVDVASEPGEPLSDNGTFSTAMRTMDGVRLDLYAVFLIFKQVRARNPQPESRKDASTEDKKENSKKQKRDHCSPHVDRDMEGDTDSGADPDDPELDDDLLADGLMILKWVKPQSATSPARAAIIAAHHHIVNRIKPVPRKAYRSWLRVGMAIDEYEKSMKAHYRVRDAQTVIEFNRLHDTQMPTNVKFSFRTFRCKCSIYQPPRGKGDRDTRTNYTGCEARFTARLQNIAVDGHKPHWRILIEDEFRLHNHPTLSTAANEGVRTMPTEGEVIDQVGVLADANATSKEISGYLSRELGRAVTTQQTRNLLRRIQKDHSAEARLKNLLHALVQVEGNDVMLIQDQLDVTCGIVIQTAVQKLCFREWGENLTMDWTHSTNNLGFHFGKELSNTTTCDFIHEVICFSHFLVICDRTIGSLIATSPAGRGVPVFDFMAINEQANTMRTILDYFKSKNPSWEKSETFIIDKDFVEWRILDECFPSAKVLLCQFHAITYWKKRVNKTFNLKTSEKDEAQGYFADMLYSIDATVAALLEHQATIINQLIYSLHRHACKSRQPATVPQFLRYISGIMSDYVMGKVRRQWDQFMVNVKKTTCERMQESCHWKVHVRGKEYACNDIEWTCTYLFYTSQHLPCQHLMFIARHGQGFDQLPRMALPERWNMAKAVELYQQLEEGANAIQPVLQVVTLKWKVPPTGSPPATLSDGATLSGQATLSDDATLSGREDATHRNAKTNKVVFIRLRRNERGNAVVLSSAEKYNYARAVFDPVIEHLQRLSRAKFYTELEMWEKIVTEAMRDEPIVSSSDATTNPDDDSESDSGCSTTLDPADCMEAMQMMNDMEMAMPTPEERPIELGVPDSPICEESSATTAAEMPLDAFDVSAYAAGLTLSQISLGDLDASEHTQSKLFSENEDGPGGTVDESDSEVDNSDAERSSAMSSVICDLATPDADPHEGTPDGDLSKVANREVDFVNLPPVVAMGKPRRQRVQNWASVASMQRYVTVVYPRDLTANIAEVVKWAVHTRKLKNVKDILEKYPVIMDEQALRGRSHIVKEEPSEKVVSY